MTSTPLPTDTAQQPAGVSAPDAIVALAAEVAEALGSATWDDERNGYDGLLESKVTVRYAGVFGPQAVTTMPAGGGVEILVDDQAHPVHQLQAVLEQLVAHVISPTGLVR